MFVVGNSCAALHTSPFQELDDGVHPLHLHLS